MTLIKFRNDVDKFGRNMDTWLDDFFKDPAFNFAKDRSYIPEANIVEVEKSFELSLSIPGMTKEDIKIKIDRDMLKVSGEHVTEEKEEGKKFHRTEFRRGSFSRSFRLPENVDRKNIGAEYEKGILTLTLPKTDVDSTSTTIEIK